MLREEVVVTYPVVPERLGRSRHSSVTVHTDPLGRWHYFSINSNRDPNVT